ncbi:MAG: carotenoid oxygenase family protein [Chloroflexota bacterium]
MKTKTDFRQGFATLDKETRIEELPVQGVIPDWLSGSLIRNGPAQFEVGKRPFRHWFDGHAMLHRFGFENGQVSYANRFLQTNSRQGDMEAETIAFGQFATDPCRSIFQRFQQIFKPGAPAHNTNVNLTKLAGEMLALTETPLPVAFDGDTLATAGVVDFADDLGFMSSTAHPHFDSVRNTGVQHLIEYGRQSTYRFAYIPNEKPLRRQLISAISVDEPGYVHSFGMTENYLILAEGPLVVNPLKLLLGGKPFIENFVWKPEAGSRFFVIDKETGEHVKTVHAKAFFTFHHINAFEEGDDIVLDISSYADAQLVQELYLERLQQPGGGQLSFPEFRRYRLTADSDHASYEVMSDYAMELPRINYANNGRSYRYAYGASIAPDRPDDFINALVKVDLETRRDSLWHEPGTYPGEPVFVAAPDAEAEDDGLILSVVLDSEAGTSFLLALDATTFSEIGRAMVPHHVPFGFHGQFFR